MTGGFRTLGHNEVNHVYESSMKEAGYKDVQYEPELQPLTGEFLRYKTANRGDDARSDLRVLGFWRRGRRAFFDFVGFNPYAKSYVKNLDSLFRAAEKRKRRQYTQRIREVEHGDFSAMVFCMTGGIGPEMSLVKKRLVTALANKREMTRSVVAGWFSCRENFAILRSALTCIRGSRPRKFEKKEANIELAVSETKVEC